MRATPVVEEAPRLRPGMIAVILVLFACAFTASEVVSARRLSATFDEPGGVAAGYAALTQSDYRVDISHPPLIRLWTALPLLAMPVHGDAFNAIDATPPETIAFQGPFDLAHRFLFRDNDADALLFRARLMTIVLGIFLGCLVFAWTCEWLGWRAGVVALVLYLTEPNLAAHSSLATNDLAVSCFFFGAVYFGWRLSRRWTTPNALGCVLFGSAAALAKFSGLMALVLVAVMASLCVLRGRISFIRALGLLAALLLVTWGLAWALYGFRYAPSPTPGWLFHLHANPAAINSVPWTAAVARWIDDHRLLPNAQVEGFVHSQGLGTGRPAFLLGQYSPTGWWYYFPVAIVLKSTVTLLALLAVGVVTLARGGRLLAVDAGAFVVLPILIFLGAAMTASLDIGVRHVLPIYPFLIVVAAAGARACWSHHPSRFVIVAGVVALASVAEFASAYPDPLGFFNVLTGGPRNGFRYLADSNVDWGQGLKPLGAWMRARHVDRVNLAYFGTADPTYYGMHVSYIWGTVMPEVTQAEVGRPELPGYVAVSATALDGVLFPVDMRDFYKPLRDREPAADLGGIKVYWVERAWW